MDQLLELVAAMTALPTDTNPWPIFASKIKEAGVVRFPDYFPRVVITCYAVCAIGIFVSLSIVVLKSLNGGAWLVSSRSTNKGRLQAPNTTLLVTIACFVSFVTSIITLHYLMQSFRFGGSPSQAIFVQCFPWMIIITITWSEIWTMASSLYLHHSSRNPFKRATPFWHPRILTGIAIAFYPIHVATTIAIFALAARSSVKSWNTWTVLESQITTSANTWQSGQKFVMTGREIWVPTLALHVERLQASLDWVSKAFILQVVYLFFVLAIFIPLSFFYGKMLSVQMQGFARTVDHTIAKSSRKYENVRRSYQLLLAQTGLVVALASLYIALSSWVVFDNKSSLIHSGNLSFIYSICFLSATMAELVICLLILYRTVQPVLQRKKQKSQIVSEGITIETETLVDIDTDDNREPVSYNLAELRLNRKSSQERAAAYAQQLQATIAFDPDLDRKSFTWDIWSRLPEHIWVAEQTAGQQAEQNTCVAY